MIACLARESGAAPATVSSELFPNPDVTDAAPHWEDAGITATCEPGDLPRHRKNVHGRGVPAALADSCRRFAPAHLQQRPRRHPAPATPPRGLLMSLSLDREANAAPFIHLRPESL